MTGQYPSTQRRGKWRRILWIVSIAAALCAAVLYTVTISPERMIDHTSLYTAWHRQKPSDLLDPMQTQLGYVTDHHWLPNGTLLRANFAPPSLADRGRNVATTLERIVPKQGPCLPPHRWL